VSVTASNMFGYTLGRELVDVGVSVKFMRNRTVMAVCESCNFQLIRQLFFSSNTFLFNFCHSQMMFAIGALLRAVAFACMVLLDRDKQK
jgi:hypothetical protein